MRHAVLTANLCHAYTKYNNYLTKRWFWGEARWNWCPCENKLGSLLSIPTPLHEFLNKGDCNIIIPYT